MTRESCEREILFHFTLFFLFCLLKHSSHIFANIIDNNFDSNFKLMDAYLKWKNTVNNF